VEQVNDDLDALLDEGNGEQQGGDLDALLDEGNDNDIQAVMNDPNKAINQEDECTELLNI
jgi:hypothetical protein